MVLVVRAAFFLKPSCLPRATEISHRRGTGEGFPPAGPVPACPSTNPVEQPIDLFCGRNRNIPLHSRRSGDAPVESQWSTAPPQEGGRPAQATPL
jgi:hypothetical protein